ncbi:kinase-like domain-containing protein [Lophiotrema nucula]|uniref:Kinase-like domain-containing protein n=1 Tax=Lophiotrema nucula TaxID=690887 RepID=A0A6A5ZL98_9PLEO|nr:kinase-like domain-containing protein [Lophiotrema nucula]
MLGALCTRASQLRRNFPCKLGTSPLDSGTFHTIHTLRFNDGVEWIARLSTKSLTLSYIPTKEDMDRFRSELATMRWLKKNTKVRLPDVYAWNVPIADRPTSHNGGAPNLQSVAWVLMERLPGVALTYDLWDTLDDEPRQKILMQIADMFLELDRYPFDVLGSLQGQLSSSNEVTIEPRIYRYSFPPVRVSSTDKLSLSPVYRDVIAQISNKEIADVITALHDNLTATLQPYESETFFLTHPDLNPTNVIIDPSTFEISGFIDWDCAHTVSSLESSIHPWFIQDRYYVKFTNEELARNLMDREYFTSCLREIQKNMSAEPKARMYIAEDFERSTGLFLLGQYLHDTVCTDIGAREKVHETLKSEVKSWLS